MTQNSQSAPTQQKSTPAPKTILDFLTPEQLNALVTKFNVLDEDVRKATTEKYFELSSAAERYIVRRMVKEANAVMASALRPKWTGTLIQWGPSFKNLSPDNKDRVIGVQRLKELREEIDEKEAITLMKKYKNSQDVTSETPWIKDMCSALGFDSKLLK